MKEAYIALVEDEELPVAILLNAQHLGNEKSLEDREKHGNALCEEGREGIANKGLCVHET